ncbi:hypothetical protein [Pseudanabaena sp. PCC 6802]|uniref:hypothetical protein n=1 Tax=Pseudanabaena sp. PCC 6802 TaxID=118173 RepID=UPI00034D89BC|nr:hypothetical protein [Pseudanabaena sp. PCC 6802]
MSPLVIGAFVVSVLLLFGLFSIIKTTFKTAFLIALVVFGLQVFTGIGPQQVFQQVLQFISDLGNWFTRWGNTAKPRSLLDWLTFAIAFFYP